MPEIVAALSGLVGLFVYWLIRLDGLDIIGAQFSASARARRMARNRDALARAAVRSVTEPRDGALALLVKIGSVDDILLPGAAAIVEDAARNIFGYGDKVTEHRTFAEYVARNTPSFSVLFRELAPLFDTKLATDEKRDLVGLLGEVAQAAGGMTPVRQAMIDEVKARLLPEKPVRPRPSAA
jgi:hypothetical protein